MIKLLGVIAIPFLTVAAVQAQYKQKMDLQLQHYLAKEHSSGGEVDLFIHGEAEAVEAAVRMHGGRVKMALPALVNARMPLDRVEALANELAVHHFEFSMAVGEVLNDSMRVKANVNAVHAGMSPLPQGFDGAGTVVGVIDTGLDVYHPDFRDENDVTRVYRYWDQRFSPNPGSPAPYGYGIEWTREELEAGGPNFPSDTLIGHGTPVAGTAVANGLANGRHKGVAPKCDIIVVATNQGTVNWASTVADGVKYIYDQAAALGKPAVVNISMGSYGGSHDGKDAAALFIENLLQAQGGRAMAVAAGNSHGDFPYHVRTEVDQDTSFTWFQTNEFPPAYNIFKFPNVFFEVWADAADFENVRFAIGADRTNPSLNFRGHTAFRTVDDAMGQVLEEPLISQSGNTLGTVQYYAQERGDQVLLQVLIASPDTADCLWRFMTTGSGAFDIWSLTTRTRTANVLGPMLAAAWFPPIPFLDPVSYPAMAHYVEPDFDKQIVDSWACLSDVLTVANYCNEVSYTDYFGVERFVNGTEQDIAPFSSSGPTRDGRMKPDVAATGDVTFTAGPLQLVDWIIANQDGWKVDPGGKHIRDGGTSQASPVVAGAAALYLQQCPNATAAEVVQALRGSARRDGFTASVPNSRWGYGKVDVFRALLNHSALSAASSSFCEGGSVEVGVDPRFEQIEWSNGAAGPTVQVTEGGALSAMMMTATGCPAYSDTLVITEFPAPATPIVNADGSVLTSSVAVGYQWYEGGSPIDDANGQEWTAYWPGTYQVEVFDENGCSSISLPMEIFTVGVDERSGAGLNVWPVPAREELNVALPEGSGGGLIRIIGGDGRLVRTARMAAERAVLNLYDLAPGVYTLQAYGAAHYWSRAFVKVP